MNMIKTQLQKLKDFMTKDIVGILSSLIENSRMSIENYDKTHEKLNETKIAVEESSNIVKNVLKSLENTEITQTGCLKLLENTVKKDEIDNKFMEISDKIENIDIEKTDTTKIEREMSEMKEELKRICDKIEPIEKIREVIVEKPIIKEVIVEKPTVKEVVKEVIVEKERKDIVESIGELKNEGKFIAKGSYLKKISGENEETVAVCSKPRFTPILCDILNRRRNAKYLEGNQVELFKMLVNSSKNMVKAISNAQIAVNDKRTVELENSYLGMCRTLEEIEKFSELYCKYGHERDD